MNRYPKLVIYLDRIRENAAKIAEFCNSHGAEASSGIVIFTTS